MYTSRNPSENRKLEIDDIIQKHPERVPVYIEKHPESNYPQIEDFKYLFPWSMALGQVYFMLRHILKLLPHDNLFVYVNEQSLHFMLTLEDIYRDYKDKDGSLCVTYSDRKINKEEEVDASL